MIWIIDFFDFIFAEENQNKDFQLKKMISKYNTTYKMIFDLKIKVVGLTIFECFYKMEHGSGG